MNEESANRIWQPNVNPTSEPVPYPGDQFNVGDRIYTKTSLELAHDHEYGRTSDDDVRALNSKIIKASESFNTTPKPFIRQNTLPASLIQSNTSFLQSNITRDSSASSERRNLLQPSNSISHNLTQENHASISNMAPKLVHNLYNSPMNLYSMNNIRKTIEAHSELIAPGVKGINFSKLDTPINKQSEVYKLVMEEEEQQHQQHQQHQYQHQQPPSQRSPIDGQQSKSNNLSSSIEQARYRTCVAEHRASTIGSNRSIALDSHQLHEQGLPRPIHSADGHSAGSNLSGSKPKCCECGQFIIGPFAKIQNRNIHPHCFNCTTCGTSLKNTGYFTINDKLYCDIHAKQVANLMQINYNFASTSNAPRPAANYQHDASFTKEQNGQYGSLERQESTKYQQSYHDLREQNSIRRDLNNTSTRPVTISTMFANQPSSTLRGENCCDGRQVRWTWRPANEDQTPSTQNAGSLHATSSNTIKSSVSLDHGYRLYHRGETNERRDDNHRSMTNTGVYHDGEPVDSQKGGKIPVCNHCRSQIRGPYILAGETTWCKPCSMNHFVCYNCNRSLLSIGFIEDNNQRYLCEPCYETYASSTCSKCNTKIKGDCLNALGKHWHPECFVCGHCRRQFGNSSFYLEDNVPYCQSDWNMLFTSKCYSCSHPIEAGDKWVEALDRNYHSQCFRCSSCGLRLEGSTFYCKNGKPYCKLHAR